MLERLKQERIKWRRERPYGFWAGPKVEKEGNCIMSEWRAKIPGPKGTAWEGGLL